MLPLTPWMRVKKKNFKPPDITPRTYDQKPFTLDGHMELDVEFNDKRMEATVYIKINTHDQLFLVFAASLA